MNTEILTFWQPTRSPAVRMLATLACLAALTACGSAETSSSPTTAPPAAVSSSPTTAAAESPAAESPKGTVPAALAFTATTVDGHSFDAATLAGQPAAVWFWAPWCPTCRAAAGTIGSVAEDYSGRVKVIGVAGLSNDAQAMKAFVTSTGIDGFPSLADTEGELYRRFSVTAQDTWAFIDASGTVTTSAGLDENELKAKLDALAG